MIVQVPKHIWKRTLHLVPEKVFSEPSETVLYLFGPFKSSGSHNFDHTYQILTKIILSESIFKDLFKYNLTVTHTITLWVFTHRIIRTVSFCISACTLRMIPVWLVHLSRAAQYCTMYSLHSLPRFSTLLCCSSRAVITNSVSARMTFILCSYSYCTYYANGRAMYYLNGASLPYWCSTQE